MPDTLRDRLERVKGMSDVLLGDYEYVHIALVDRDAICEALELALPLLRHRADCVTRLAWISYDKGLCEKREALASVCDCGYDRLQQLIKGNDE